MKLQTHNRKDKVGLYSKLLPHLSRQIYIWEVKSGKYKKKQCVVLFFRFVFYLSTPLTTSTIICKNNNCADFLSCLASHCIQHSLLQVNTLEAFYYTHTSSSIVGDKEEACQVMLSIFYLRPCSTAQGVCVHISSIIK